MNRLGLKGGGGFFFGIRSATLVRAFVLGPLLENNLRKSLIMSRGDFSLFFIRPLSAASLILALFRVVSLFIPGLREKAEKDSQAGACVRIQERRVPGGCQETRGFPQNHRRIKDLTKVFPMGYKPDGISE